jgi:hypothetical protein
MKPKRYYFEEKYQANGPQNNISAEQKVRFGKGNNKLGQADSPGIVEGVRNMLTEQLKDRMMSFPAKKIKLRKLPSVKPKV